MIDPNDKWVWDDEPDSLPQGGPLLERRLEPILDWFEKTPEPPLDAEKTPEPRPASLAAPPAVEPNTTAPASAEPVPAAPPAPNPAERSSCVVKATMLHLEGQVAEAIEELRSGLRGPEPHTELYAAMGGLQMELERFADAASSYREVLKRDPGNETSIHNLELCEQKIRDASKPPQPPQSLFKAMVLHMEGRLEDAIRELQRAVKAGEKSPDIYAALGHLQFETGRFDQAAESYTLVVERDPQHRSCHYNLAVSLEKSGRHKEALRSFEKAVEINPARVEFGIGVGVTLLHLKRFGEAAAAFETCLKSHPGDGVALFGKAFALHCQGRKAEAEAVYLETLKGNPAHEEALTNLVALTGSPAYSEKLLALRPESKIALETMMASELARENYEAACAIGERLTRVVADSFEAWLNFGVACRGARRLETAVAAFSKAARIRPKSFEAQSSLGAALDERGDLAGAKSAYEAALKLSPDHAAVLWNLARVAEQSGDSKEAERLLMALAKSPQAEPALFRLGALRFERGDYAGSAEAFRSCLKARADWPAAQLNLGLALWKSDNRDEARKKLESVNGSFAGEALHALASMAAEREEYPVALAYYKKLAESGERTPDVYYNLGLILQNLGKTDEAAQQYRAALAAQPDMAEALQALAQITRGPARVEEIRKGVKKEPTLGPRLLKSR
jgi:tetratricopeptide (TPR) repeat protein